MLGIGIGFSSRINTTAVVPLPTLPKAHQSSRPWTEQDDARLMYERDERGQTWLCIQYILDREKNELVLRYGYLTRMAAKRLRQGANIMMACMTCAHEFMSENRVTNRRCDPCKNSADGLPEGWMCFGGSRAGRSAHAE